MKTTLLVIVVIYGLLAATSLPRVRRRVSTQRAAPQPAPSRRTQTIPAIATKSSSSIAAPVASQGPRRARGGAIELRFLHPNLSHVSTNSEDQGERSHCRGLPRAGASFSGCSSTTASSRGAMRLCCSSPTILNLAERDHPNNFTVGKFYVIDAIKAELETACPGIVSCADILAAAAAEAVEQSGGPHIDLGYGRRDGLDSFAPAAKTTLSGSTLQVGGLLENFLNVGLNLTDVVALSGEHTIGQARCSTFADRFAPDTTSPFIDVPFGQSLESYCVDGNAAGIDRRMTLDANSTTAFDNGYFRSLLVGRGILTSDDVLRTDPRTKDLVALFAKDQGAFFAAFAESMAKMGRISVLTGTMGHVRRQCWVRNSIDTSATPEANLDFSPASVNFCRPADCPTAPTCSGVTP